ncbi:DUF917 domain-containing protein [Actinomadura kijaniata]|uniref:DUF917 domain-containing protein n=1 Tax=Actinomadura kijaniata TaxID=46161 RepID=UPI000A7C1D1F|nr:DUF917 domain-containing protein [Actinomadura kijaniata]
MTDMLTNDMRATGQICAADLPDIARGAALLGTGGGGDPYLGRLLAERVLRERGPVEVVRPEQLPDDAVVVPVGVMGAPTVIVEKPLAGHEFRGALESLGAVLGRPVTHVACLEAGGLNSMTPIITAAETGLPLLDADGMGRAFPELQMVLPTLDGISASPMAMSDEKGNTVVLRTVDNGWSERLARSATVDMGCSAAIALYPMTGAQARTALVPGTLTLAGRLGEILRVARAEHADAAERIVEQMGGTVLFRGKVVDVERRTERGFARGLATLAGTGAHAGTEMMLAFQNEHLVAQVAGQVVASVPDLICVLDADTGEPVTTEAMRYGFRIAVLGLPCHPRWRSEAGLALAGPRYFGYDHDFVPVETLAAAR